MCELRGPAGLITGYLPWCVKLPGGPLKLITTYQNAFDRLGQIITCFFKDFDCTTKILYLALVVPLKMVDN